MSKGDWTRPVDKEKYDESFERVFGRKEIKTWDPDREEESENPLRPDETPPIPDGGPRKESLSHSQKSRKGGSHP